MRKAGWSKHGTGGEKQIIRNSKKVFTSKEYSCCLHNESPKGWSYLRDILQSVSQFRPQVLNITPLALLNRLTSQMNVVHR